MHQSSIALVNMATTGLLLIKILMVAAGNNSRIFAMVKLSGFPNSKLLSQAIAPVSRNPETTTYKTAMVIMPGLANPAKASVGDRIPLIINRPKALKRIVSAGKRLLASSNREQTNINVTATRSIGIKNILS